MLPAPLKAMVSPASAVPSEAARFAVAGGVAAGKEVRQGNLHSLGNFREGLQRGDGVAVFDPRQIATQQAGAALDVALRQSSVRTIRFDDFADVNFGLLFGHG